MGEFSYFQCLSWNIGMLVKFFSIFQTLQYFIIIIITIIGIINIIA